MVRLAALSTVCAFPLMLPRNGGVLSCYAAVVPQQEGRPVERLLSKSWKFILTFRFLFAYDDWAPVTQFLSGGFDDNQ
jgi:hypothetical protein